MMSANMIQPPLHQPYSYRAMQFRGGGTTMLATVFWLSLHCLTPLSAQSLMLDNVSFLESSFRSWTGGKQRLPQLEPSGSPTRLGDATSRTYPDFRGTGQPTSHGGAASRESGACPSTDIPLTALVPSEADPPEIDYSGGYTTQSTPTLWVYVPFALDANNPITFSLVNSQNYPVYEVFQTVHHDPGVVKLSLPPTVTLELEQVYRWYFMVHCDDPLGVRDANIVDGWIKRVDSPLSNEASTNRNSLLESAQSIAQSDAYASHLIWYDALTVLGNSLLKVPNDQQLVQAWTNLLGLPSIQLDDISTAPLQNCCTLLHESIE